MNKHQYTYYVSKYLDRSGIPGNKYEDLERNLLSSTISNSNTIVARYIDVIYLKECFLEVWQISPKTASIFIFPICYALKFMLPASEVPPRTRRIGQTCNNG
jgi:hypothetical protein